MSRSDSFLNDPAFMPFRLDSTGRRVLFVHLDREQRAQATFLDERALGSNPRGVWVPLDAMPPFVDPVPACDFLFHIGHCGSTLLTHLLASLPATQVLREPLVLRTLTEELLDAGLPTGRFSEEGWRLLFHGTLGRLARPLAPDTRTIIKATSSCNALACDLLSLFPHARGVFLDIPLRSYLATLLKSPDSMRDAVTTAPARLAWLRKLIGDNDALVLHRLTLPEQCAMVWLAERARLGTLRAGSEGVRLLHVDFEELLGDPRETLARIALHLGGDDAWIDDALRSPVWGRYSKAQQHGYGVDDRRHDLARSMELNAAAIREAEAFATVLQRTYEVLS